MARIILGLVVLAAFSACAVAQVPANAPAKGQVTLAAKVPAEFVAGDNATVELRWAGLPASGSFTTHYELVDWLDKSVWTGSAQGTPQSVDVPVARYGSYWLKVSVTPAGKEDVLAKGQLRLTKPVPVPTLTPAEREKSSIGVNTHAQAHWRALAAMGIHMARDYSWSFLGAGEKAPMSGNGTDFSRVVRDADAAGVTILPCMQHIFLTGSPVEYINDPAKVRNAFKRYSQAFPTIKYWELDNESDIRFHGSLAGFDTYMAGYQRFMTWAYEGLKDAGHGAVVVPNGDAGIYPDRLALLLNSPVKDLFVTSNSHFYTGTIPPELSRSDHNTGSRDLSESRTFLDQLRKIARLSHAHGKQAWLTEVGWDATAGPAVGEPNQAKYLARVYLLARDCGMDKTFWFFDREAGELSGIFATCGLLDKNSLMRPCGAALAAVSKFTAQTEYGGSIDLGADRWCLLFKPATGPWVAAAWSVEKDYPLPEVFTNVPAADIFGNDVRPEKITSAPSYFFFDQLPAGWDAQRKASWISPTILPGYPGGSVTAQAEVPAGTTITWKSLPAGVTGSQWTVKDGQASATLSVAGEASLGEQTVVAQASGESWSREWPVVLKIADAVAVLPEPYLPGAESRVWLQSSIENLPATALSSKAGTFDPAALKVGPELTGVVFKAAADAAGPQQITVRVGDAKPETHWIAPEIVSVPRAGNITIDGKLDEWPAGNELSANYFAHGVASFTPTMHVAWSPEGLYLAASMPVRSVRGGRPDAFWEAPNIEMFVDSTGKTQKGWQPGTHQFWLIPLARNGGMVAGSGEFKRSASIPANILDDKRVKKAMSVQNGVVTFEAFFPAEALGAKPAAGQIWRAGLSAQDGESSAAWPRSKRDGLLEAGDKWGQFKFVD